MLSEIYSWLSFVFYFVKSILYVFHKKKKTYTCMVGKTVLITGGNSGIGYYTALEMACRGCRVIIADVVDLTESKKRIVRLSKNENVVAKYLDLASNDSIREFAKDIVETEQRLDVLINNAGIGACKGRPIMQINHFGPFLLTHLLLDLLKKSKPSRLIFVSSILAFNGDVHNETLLRKDSCNDEWSCSYMYSNSKLCKAIVTMNFARILKKHGVTSNCLHPGAVRTTIFDAVNKSFSWNAPAIFLFDVFLSLILAKTPEEGAQTSIFLATSEEVENITGEFFIEQRIFDKPRELSDEKLCKKIWRFSEERAQLKDDEKILE